MRLLDLFSGIGGFSLGLERAGMTTVAFCEIDPYCRAVLKKHWPEVPIYEDVRTLNYDGPVDIICGGYPCQPFSVAGKREGAEDDRHLWPAMFDLIKKHRPTWVIGENVAGHISMGLDQVLADLESEAYSARAFVIPACAVDAQHRRDRVWIVGNARRLSDEPQRECELRHGTPGEVQGETREQRVRAETSNTSEDVADTTQLQRNGSGENRQQSKRQVSKSGNGSSKKSLAYSDSIYAQGIERKRTYQEERQEQRERPAGSQDANGGRFWLPEPNVGRVAYGISDRVDRLRALGNAVVPQIPEMIGRAIMAAESGAS